MTEVEVIITSNPAIGLANLIGLSQRQLSAGDDLPLGFHILYFNAFGPIADVGHDGHPKRAASAELVEFPRRMFAGSRIEFKQPLQIGDHARRSVTIIDRTRKEGSTGALLFQRQGITISNKSGLCVSEVQNIVYRGEAPSTPPEQRSVRVAQHIETFQPDEVALFCFSALSGNSHRIHYDLPYAMSAEGYPALVVHGPFIALKLLSFAVHLGAPRTVRFFEFRAVSALFLGIEARLCAVEEAGRLYLWAERQDGSLCMTAEAGFG